MDKKFKRFISKLLVFITVFSFMEYTGIVFDFSPVGEDNSPIDVMAARTPTPKPHVHNANCYANAQVHSHVSSCYDVQQTGWRCTGQFGKIKSEIQEQIPSRASDVYNMCSWYKEEYYYCYCKARCNSCRKTYQTYDAYVQVLYQKDDSADSHNINLIYYYTPNEDTAGCCIYCQSPDTVITSVSRTKKTTITGKQMKWDERTGQVVWGKDNSENYAYPVYYNYCPECGAEWTWSWNMNGQTCDRYDWYDQVAVCGLTGKYIDKSTGAIATPVCDKVGTSISPNILSTTYSSYKDASGIYQLPATFDFSKLNLATVGYLSGTSKNNVSCKIFRKTSDNKWVPVTLDDVKTTYNTTQEIILTGGDYALKAGSYGSKCKAGYESGIIKVFIKGYFAFSTDAQPSAGGTYTFTGTPGTGANAGKYLAGSTLKTKIALNKGYYIKSIKWYNAETGEIIQQTKSTDSIVQPSYGITLYNSGGVLDKNESMPASNTKAVCEFAPIPFTIKFNTGTSETFSDFIVSYANPMPSLPTPVRENYIFMGWTFGDRTVFANALLDFMPESGTTITLTADWAERSTYKQVTYDDTVGELPSPRRLGYTFRGWATSEMYNNGYFSTLCVLLYLDSVMSQVTEDTIVKLTDNRIIHAKWEPDKCLVYFDANGGTIKQSSTTGTKITWINSGLASKYVYYDSVFGKMPTAEWTDHTFLKWSFTKDGTGTVNENYIWQDSNADTAVTLYAIWLDGAEPAKTIKVSVYGNYPDGTGNDTPVYTFNITQGQKFTKLNTAKTKLSSDVMSANTFVGFYTVPETVGGYSYDATMVSSETENLKLYARWKHLISYEKNTIDNNGNALTSTVQGVMPEVWLYGGEHDHIVMSCAYVCEGYTFQGWNTEPDGSGTTYKAGKTVSTYGDLKLYAIWKRNAYVVKLDARGGRFDLSAEDPKTYMAGYATAASVKSLSIKYGNKIPNTAVVPQKLGYTFKGYYTGINGSGVQVYDSTGTYSYEFSATRLQWNSKNGIALGEITTASKNALMSNKTISVLDLDYLYAYWEYDGSYRDYEELESQPDPVLSDDGTFTGVTTVAGQCKLIDDIYDPYAAIPSTEKLGVEADISSYVVEYSYSSTGGSEKQSVTYDVRNLVNSAADPIVFTYQVIDPTTEELVFHKVTWSKDDAFTVEKYIQYLAILNIGLYVPESVTVGASERANLYGDKTAELTAATKKFAKTVNSTEGYTLYSYGDVSFKIYANHATETGENVITLDPEKYFYIATNASGKPIKSNNTASFGGLTKEELVNIILSNNALGGAGGRSDEMIIGTPAKATFTSEESIELNHLTPNNKYTTQYDITYKRADQVKIDSNATDLPAKYAANTMTDTNKMEVLTPVASKLDDIYIPISTTDIMAEFTITPNNSGTFTYRGYGEGNYIYSGSGEFLLYRYSNGTVANGIMLPFDVWDKETHTHYDAETFIPFNVTYAADGTPSGGRTFLTTTDVTEKMITASLTRAVMATIAVNAPSAITGLATKAPFAKSTHDGLAWDYIFPSQYYNRFTNDGINKYISYDTAEADARSTSSIKLVVGGKAIEDLISDGLGYLYLGEDVDFYLDTAGAFSAEGCTVELKPSYVVRKPDLTLLNADMFAGLKYSTKVGYVSHLKNVYSDECQAIEYSILQDMDMRPSAAELTLTEALFGNTAANTNNFSTIRRYNSILLTSTSKFVRDTSAMFTKYSFLTPGVDINGDGFDDSIQKSQVRWYGSLNLPEDLYIVEQGTTMGTCTEHGKQWNRNHSTRCPVCGREMQNAGSFILDEGTNENYIVYNFLDYLVKEGYVDVELDVIVKDSTGNVISIPGVSETDAEGNTITIPKEKLEIVTKDDIPVLIRYKIGTKASDKWMITY